ncbi:MAG: hypothetical protein HKO57_16935, partial [Akkermansiaceae bacterium]|nr:hypothetical protein [Akkermansiaceae bacterium]
MRIVPFAALALLAALAPVAPAEEAPVIKGEIPPGRPKWAAAIPGLAPIDNPTAGEVEASIRRGVDFLISSQNPNGSWGGPTMTKGLNIYAPIPGAHHAFRAGSSGTALYGILETGDLRPETQECIEKAEAYFLKELPRLRRADLTTTYNVWGHAYGLRALSKLYLYREGDPARQSAIKNLAQQQVDMLERYEDVDRGWGYLDFEAFTRKPSGIPTCFTTATVLIAMHEAREIMGVALPAKEVRRAVTAIQEQRTPDFAYVYSISHRLRPRYGINRPGGSLARSQVCSAALRYFGDEAITDEVLEVWLDRFILRNGWLDIARKRPIPHETHFSNSGYFYYYGFFYATDCV